MHGILLGIEIGFGLMIAFALMAGIFWWWVWLVSAGEKWLRKAPQDSRKGPENSFCEQ